MFEHCITSMAELRELIPDPDAPAVNKDIDHIDEGGPPGFVRVLDDHRLAVPDYPGNRRLDSWSNVLATGHLARDYEKNLWPAGGE